MTGPSPKGLPRALGWQRVPAKTLQILTAGLLADLMGRAGSMQFPVLPEPAPTSPLIICSVSSQALNAPCHLLHSTGCLQLPCGDHACFPRHLYSSRVLCSPAPQGCSVVPQTTGLSPTCPRAINPSLCISLPVMGAICPWQWVPSHPIAPRPGPCPSLEGSHLPPAALRFLVFQSTEHTIAHTHTSLLPVDAKPLREATLLGWELTLMLLPGLPCSGAAHSPGRGRLEAGSSCRFHRHLPGLLVGSGTPLGKGLRNVVQGASPGELQQGAGRTYPAPLPAALPGQAGRLAAPVQPLPDATLQCCGD